MRLLTALLAALVVAVPAQALGGKTLRVDRPQKGDGARLTHVRLVAGVVRHRMGATVLSDSRCAPDPQGVSHCLNRMRLANGTVVTVVHDHRMATMPCLSPGEQVTLTPGR